MRARLLFGILTITATPTVVFTDYTGFLSIVTAIYVVPPSALINLVLLAYFAGRRRYRSRRFALTHSAFASIGPLLGVCAVLLEPARYHWTDAERSRCMTVAAVAMALAWLPLLVHRLQRTPAPTLPGQPPA